MGVGRLAPHRLRARYAKALKEIPLPVRSFAGIDPGTLTIIGEAEIAGRTLQFAIMAGTPRLWITAPGCLPPVVGYLTGLDGTADGGLPDLHLTELDHLEWAIRVGLGARIKRAGLAAWNSARRDCEG